MMGITLRGGKEYGRRNKLFARFTHEGAKDANLGTGFRILTDIRGELTLQGADDTGGLKASYHLESQGESGSKNYWQDVGKIGSGSYSGSDGTSFPGWIHAPVIDDASVIIGSNAPHAAVTEYGRGVGKTPPPVDALVGWLRRHGLPEGMKYALAKKISKRPIPARPAFLPSIEGNRNVHARLQAAALRKAAKRASKTK